MGKFDRIFKFIQKGKLTLFVGAGFSLKAGAPSVTKLKDAFINDFPMEDREGLERKGLDEITELYVHNCCNDSRNEMNDILEREFLFERKDLSDHVRLTKIPHIKQVFTTNYDSLLEEAYGPNWCQVIRHSKDAAYLDENKVAIYKIHGDLEAKDDIIITQSDYKRFVGGAPDKYLWNILMNQFITKNFLFLGYSLKDSNVLNSLLEVEQQLSNNRREHFIVVPDMKKSEADRLKRHGVEYIQGTATEFLTALYDYLERNAKYDLENGIQAKENITFLKQHNISPTINFDNEKNHITKVHSLDGQPLLTKCHFMLSEKYASLFDNFNFEKQGVISKTGGIPHLEIPASEIKDFNYSIGGISFAKSEGLQNMLIFPSGNRMDVTVSVSECEFIKKTTCIIYRNAPFEFVLQLDCEAFFMKFSCVFENEDSNLQGGDFSVDFKDDYSDNELAIKWMAALHCISKGGGLSIYINGMSPINIKGLQDDNNEKYYSRCLEYYNNLKKIELGLNVCFEKYEIFSYSRFQDSIKLVNAISKKPILMPDKNRIFSYSIPKTDEYSDFVKNIKTGGTFVGITTQQTDENVILCGHAFGPIFAKILYVSCHAVSFSSSDNDKYLLVEMKNDNNYCQVWWGFEPFTIGSNPENMLE